MSELKDKIISVIRETEPDYTKMSVNSLTKYLTVIELQEMVI